MKRMVDVEIPEDLLLELNVPKQQASEELKKLTVLELYREGIFSLSKAAEMVEMSIQDFLSLSADRSIPIHYTKKNLEKDLETIKKLFP